MAKCAYRIIKLCSLHLMFNLCISHVYKVHIVSIPFKWDKISGLYSILYFFQGRPWWVRRPPLWLTSSSSSSSTSANLHKRVPTSKDNTIVLTLDGNLKIGAHAGSNLCYLICFGHLNRSRAVTNQIYFRWKDLFSFMRA